MTQTADMPIDRPGTKHMVRNGDNYLPYIRDQMDRHRVEHLLTTLT